MGLDVGLDLVPGLVDGGDLGDAYASRLITVYGLSEVWRLTNITGSSIPATANTARNGTAVGWDIVAPNAVAGPVKGESGLAPYSDGANDYGDINTASLLAAFDGTIMSFGIWVKMSAAQIANTAARRAFTLINGANTTSMFILKTDEASFRMLYRVASTNIFVDVAMANFAADTWTLIGVDCKDANNGDLIEVFVNGVSKGTDTGTGAYGANIETALLGASSTVPANPWLGHLAYAMIKFGGIVGVANWLAMYNEAVT